MIELKRIVITVLSVMLIIYLGLQMLVIMYPSFSSRAQKADAALILGYALKDGLVPDSWSEARLEKGIELYNSGYVKKIIISGGQGLKDKIQVSIAMKKWIVNKGIPEADVITEDNAHSTVENLKFSIKICESNGFNNLIVVTNDFHAFRSMIIARDILINQCTVASAKISLSPKKCIAYLKEPIALIRYWIFKQ